MLGVCIEKKDIKKMNGKINQDKFFFLLVA